MARNPCREPVGRHMTRGRRHIGCGLRERDEACNGLRILEKLEDGLGD
jgi:hypothetical protein